MFGFLWKKINICSFLQGQISLRRASSHKVRSSRRSGGGRHQEEDQHQPRRSKILLGPSDYHKNTRLTHRSFDAGSSLLVLPPGCSGRRKSFIHQESWKITSITKLKKREKILLKLKFRQIRMFRLVHYLSPFFIHLYQVSWVSLIT